MHYHCWPKRQCWQYIGWGLYHTVDFGHGHEVLQDNWVKAGLRNWLCLGSCLQYLNMGTDRGELSSKLHKNMFQAFRTEQRSNLQPQAKPGVRADIPPAPYNSSPPLSTLASQWSLHKGKDVDVMLWSPEASPPRWWRRRWRPRSRSWRSRSPGRSPERLAPGGSSSKQLWRKSYHLQYFALNYSW